MEPDVRAGARRSVTNALYTTFTEKKPPFVAVVGTERSVEFPNGMGAVLGRLTSTTGYAFVNLTFPADALFVPSDTVNVDRLIYGNVTVTQSRRSVDGPGA